MKRIIIIVIAILAFLDCKSQELSNSKYFNSNDLDRNVELAAGMMFKKAYCGLKFEASLNNIVYERWGFYTSMETCFSGRVFNICGATVSANEWFYFFGGVDVFTKNGLIQSGFRGIRKEMGIGITPYKWAVARFGWSFSIGPTATIGVRFNI